MQDRGVTGEAIDIPTPDGIMDGYAAHPAGAGPFPLVVLFMDIWGLREELFAIVRRIAAEGYYCVVPNLFYREGKIRYERRNADGRMGGIAVHDSVRSGDVDCLSGHATVLHIIWKGRRSRC